MKFTISDNIINDVLLELFDKTASDVHIESLYPIYKKYFPDITDGDIITTNLRKILKGVESEKIIRFNDKDHNRSLGIIITLEDKGISIINEFKDYFSYLKNELSKRKSTKREKIWKVASAIIIIVSLCWNIVSYFIANNLKHNIEQKDNIINKRDKTIDSLKTINKK